MTIRSRREIVTFKHPFQIRGVDRVLPAGAYEVVTDEEMIEGLSFASFRRIATLIIVPAAASRGSAMKWSPSDRSIWRMPSASMQVRLMNQARHE